MIKTCLKFLRSLKKSVHYRWALIKRRYFIHEVTILFKHQVRSDVHAPIEIRDASNENLGDPIIFSGAQYLKTFQKILARGDKGYFAYRKGICVHRSWVAFGPGEYTVPPFLKLCLKKDDACIQYCHTHPEFRGQKIFPAVLMHIVKDLGKRHKNIYVYSNAENRSSRSAIATAGFAEIERLRVITLFNIRIWPLPGIFRSKNTKENRSKFIIIRPIL